MALAIGVAVVVLVTALPSSEEPPRGLEGLEQLGTAQRELQAQVAALGQALAVTNQSLAEALAVTNRSLAEALAVTSRSLTEVRGQWESCRNELVGGGVRGGGENVPYWDPLAQGCVRGLLCAAPSLGRGRAGA